MAASPASVVLGKSATLIWTTTNANSVSLDNAIGAVPVTGSLAVAPSQTTTYTAIATNSVLTASASATVTVTYPLPTVKISAAPTIISPGGTATLTWTSTGATAASMDNGIGSVPVNGSRAVTPAKTTTYKITVTGLGGSASASAAVTIKYPAPTVTFTTAPDAIPPGGSATLTWTTTNATSASIDNGVGTVAINGSKVVSPKIATTYTITVTGQGGTVRASVTVKMLDAVLKAIWNNMKTAMIAGNIDGAASYFIEDTKQLYQEIFTNLLTDLPQIAQTMQNIEAVYFNDAGAQYRIRRKEIINGTENDITYYIYFIQDENGSWKILRF